MSGSDNWIVHATHSTELRGRLHNVDEFFGQVAMEHLFKMMPSTIYIKVKEKKPKMQDEAAQWTDTV